jgi:hypothetical protein
VFLITTFKYQNHYSTDFFFEKKADRRQGDIFPEAISETNCFPIETQSVQNKTPDANSPRLHLFRYKPHANFHSNKSLQWHAKRRSRRVLIFKQKINQWSIFRLKIESSTDPSVKVKDFSINIIKSKPTTEFLFALNNSNPIDVSGIVLQSSARLHIFTFYPISRSNSRNWNARLTKPS